VVLTDKNMDFVNWFLGAPWLPPKVYAYICRNLSDPKISTWTHTGPYISVESVMPKICFPMDYEEIRKFRSTCIAFIDKHINSR